MCRAAIQGRDMCYKRYISPYQVRKEQVQSGVCYGMGWVRVHTQNNIEKSLIGLTLNIHPVVNN